VRLLEAATIGDFVIVNGLVATGGQGGFILAADRLVRRRGGGAVVNARRGDGARNVGQRLEVFHRAGPIGHEHIFDKLALFRVNLFGENLQIGFDLGGFEFRDPVLDFPDFSEGGRFGRLRTKSQFCEDSFHSCSIVLLLMVRAAEGGRKSVFDFSGGHIGVHIRHGVVVYGQALVAGFIGLGCGVFVHGGGMLVVGFFPRLKRGARSFVGYAAGALPPGTAGRRFGILVAVEWMAGEIAVQDFFRGEGGFAAIGDLAANFLAGGENNISQFAGGGVIHAVPVRYGLLALVIVDVCEGQSVQPHWANLFGFFAVKDNHVGGIIFRAEKSVVAAVHRFFAGVGPADLPVGTIGAILQGGQPAIGDGFLGFVMLEVFVVNEHAGEARLGGFSVETIDDAFAGFVVNNLDDAGAAVGMLALGFDLIPSIVGVQKIAIEYSCVHARFPLLACNRLQAVSNKQPSRVEHRGNARRSSAF